MLPKEYDGIYYGKDYSNVLGVVDFGKGIRMDKYGRIYIPSELKPRIKNKDKSYGKQVLIFLIQRHQKGLLLIPSKKHRSRNCPFMSDIYWIEYIDKQGRLRIPYGKYDYAVDGDVASKVGWGAFIPTRNALFREAGLDFKNPKNNRLVMIAVPDGIEVWERQRWQLEKRIVNVFLYKPILDGKFTIGFSKTYFIEGDKKSICEARKFIRRWYRPEITIFLLESLKKCVLVSSYERLKKVLWNFGEIEETETVTPLDMRYTICPHNDFTGNGTQAIMTFDKVYAMDRRICQPKTDEYHQKIICKFTKRVKHLYLMDSKEIVRTKKRTKFPE